LTVGRGWVVTTVEIAIEGGLRFILERRKPTAERLLEGCGGGPSQADHLGDRPTLPRAIRKVGHYMFS
jgi:hypothetical protein